MLKRARRMAAVFVLLCFSGAGLALAATPPPTAALPDFTSIVQKYGPAVVNVVAHYNHASEMGSDSPDQQQPQQPQIPDIFRHFFGMPFGPQFQGPSPPGESPPCAARRPPRASRAASSCRRLSDSWAWISKAD